MSITQQDAAEALRLTDEAGQRSTTLRQYQNAAPHLILWGGIYAATYAFGQFAPDRAGLAWAVMVPAGVAGDIIIARRMPACISGTLFAVLFATFLAFITATAAIMRPQDPRQMAAFVPLVVALGYILLGLRGAPRLAWTGVALGVLTLVGYVAVPGMFLLWMAVVGGGALVLGGVWLRRI